MSCHKLEKLIQEHNELYGPTKESDDMKNKLAVNEYRIQQCENNTVKINTDIYDLKLSIKKLQFKIVLHSILLVLYLSIMGFLIYWNDC